MADNDKGFKDAYKTMTMRSGGGGGRSKLAQKSDSAQKSETNRSIIVDIICKSRWSLLAQMFV